MAEFNYSVEISTRFRDIDAMQHVNNAVYATYIEQARVRYVEDIVDEEFMSLGAVIASLEIEFRKPIEFGEYVTVAVRTGKIGRSSIPQEYEIRVDGTVAATASTVMVPYDPETGESQPVPDSWREAFDVHEGRA